MQLSLPKQTQPRGGNMNSLQYAVHKQLQRHARINTQKELAEYVDIEESKFSRILNNPERKLDQVQIDRLQSFLNVTAEDIEDLLAVDAMSDEQLKAKNAAIEAQLRLQSWEMKEINNRLVDIEKLLNEYRLEAKELNEGGRR